MASCHVGAGADAGAVFVFIDVLGVETEKVRKCKMIA
jgi:hypothetical protein